MKNNHARSSHIFFRSTLNNISQQRTLGSLITLVWFFLEILQPLIDRIAYFNASVDSQVMSFFKWIYRQPSTPDKPGCTTAPVLGPIRVRCGTEDSPGRKKAGTCTEILQNCCFPCKLMFLIIIASVLRYFKVNSNKIQE